MNRQAQADTKFLRSVNSAVLLVFMGVAFIMAAGIWIRPAPREITFNKILEGQKNDIKLDEQFVKNEDELIQVIERQNKLIKKLQEQVNFVSNHQGVYQTKLIRLEQWVAILLRTSLPQEEIRKIPDWPLIIPLELREEPKAIKIPKPPIEPAIAEKPAKEQK